MTQRVKVTVPTRIDLGGGTLDIAPLHQILERKATVNFGITVFAEAEATVAAQFEIKSDDFGVHKTGDFRSIVGDRDLPLLSRLMRLAWDESLPPVKLETRSQSPTGAGLGGSSCLAVAIYVALRRLRHELRKEVWQLDDHELVRTVQDAEIPIIFAPTGCQDYWGGVRGGINVISFPPGETKVETFPISHLPGLSEQLIVCYSGKSRASARNNWEIFKRAFERDTHVTKIINKIGAISEELAASIRRGSLSDTFMWSQKEWELRTALWADIESPETQRLDRAAKNAGANFTRVCGAGGGGVMAVFANKEDQPKVIKALQADGGIILDAKVAASGYQMILQ